MTEKFNNNIRCIEIINHGKTKQLGITFNNNIRCIEIVDRTENELMTEKFNNNIRCIEITVSRLKCHATWGLITT